MKNGLTLMEEHFCNLVAIGRTAREAYSEAYSVVPKTSREQHSVDNKASRLVRRPDIAARILEAAGEQKRRNRAKWDERGETIAEGIYTAIQEAITSVDKDGRPCILSPGALKGVEVLAKLKGLNAPDETVLKDGGKADDPFMPRGLAALSDENLRKIAGETVTIDVDAEGGES